MEDRLRVRENLFMNFRVWLSVMSERGRYWLVRVCECVEWLSLLPKSVEVWRVCGSRSVRDALCYSQEYVVRYDNPVSQRHVCKLPVVSVSMWTCEPTSLKDANKYVKVKWQDQGRISFYQSFNHKTNLI